MSNKPENDPLYRKNVGIIVLNKDGKVFMAKRVDFKNEISAPWQFPQGGMDDGETVEQTGLRELYEETGIKSVRLLKISKEWYAYNYPPKVHYLTPDKRKFKGQVQRWILVEFTGNESEININKDPIEFCDWEWKDPTEAPQLIVEFKRPIYEKVIAEFFLS